VFFLYVSRVAQSVYCLATGWTTGLSRFDLRQRRKDFSSSLCVHTGSGAHPASCTVGTMGPFLWVKRGRSVTLTTHPIYCRSHERVGAIQPHPPSTFVACNGTAFFFLVVSLHNNLLHLPHQCITALLALGANVGFEQHVSIVKQPSSGSHLHFVHTQFSMSSNVKIYYLMNLWGNTKKAM
jgi:hypothetical protein